MPTRVCVCRVLCSCSVSVYYFPTEDDDDEDGPTFMEKAIEATKQGIDMFCVWDCCQPWLSLQSWISFIVFDPFVELFITLCIVVNTLFMALDHHDMDRNMEKILKRGNYVSGLRTKVATLAFSGRFGGCN